ncbi:MAG: RNA polymerase sigma factor [Bacteroidales bacterium]
MEQTGINEILEGCRAGKRPAQEKLFRMFADEMFGVCQYYSKDLTEAEDTLHEGFMKIFAKIDQYRHEGSLAGWMKRIMINTALEKYRKQPPLYVVGDNPLPETDIEPDRVTADLSAEDLLRMVRELSPQYRMVFNLYAIDGYSHKEIAEMMGISEGTSKSNLARARQILQKKVKDEFYVNKNKSQRI